MFRDLLRTIKAFVILFGVLLTFFAILEVIRAFQTLNSLHPAAGVVFLLVLLGGGLWLAICFLRRLVKVPGR